MSATTVIRVGGDSPYDVVVGHGVLDEVVDVVGEDALRVAVLHAPSVARFAARVEAALSAAGRRTVVVELPDAEAAKDVAVVERAWSALGAAGFTRSDCVVAVGGGATTDVAGFVAATWLRGVRVVHVPTTTLGMVDAAVGGKTGINTAAGKNLVGSFHPPAGVLVDLDVLASLPVEEHRAGLAEVVKAGFIADPGILDLVERSPARALDPAAAEVRELLERAIAVKAAVVSADLRESATSGPSREILNYGHTFAHAVEKVEDYHWRHGHAVSVGMVYVAELARLSGLLDPEVAGRHRAVLGSLGLPLAYRGDRWPELLAAMAVDKKARGARLRFIVLEGLARPVVLDAPDEELLAAAYREVSA